MILIVNDLIKCNDINEWISIQKYLFNLGYTWCNESVEEISLTKDEFPSYILIEVMNNKLMFSYMNSNYFNFYKNYNLYNAKVVLRNDKLKKIIR